MRQARYEYRRRRLRSEWNGRFVCGVRTTSQEHVHVEAGGQIEGMARMVVPRRAIATDSGPGEATKTLSRLTFE